ncbi:MAG: hypothetical protein LBQ71_02350 [Hungatella sp.]|jgi:hypothetical protein|nr:hypothetical protein [Hungatella sp.]
MPEINDMLMKKVKADRAVQEEQEELRKKHKIKNKNVVVVEKSSNFKFLINTLRGILIVAVLIAIAFLIFIALTAICYPEPKQGLQIVYLRGIEELSSYFHDPSIVSFLNKIAEMLKHGLS